MLLALAISTATANNDLPPYYYQGNAVPTVITTVDNPNTKEACGVAPPGGRILACEYSNKDVPIIIMPNPCRFPEAADKSSYAHLMCHELGHANGWNSDHDN